MSVLKLCTKQKKLPPWVVHTIHFASLAEVRQARDASAFYELWKVTPNTRERRIKWTRIAGAAITSCMRLRE